MHENNCLVPDDIFMSKRLQVASMAMQGMIENAHTYYTKEELAKHAYAVADEMIAGESCFGKPVPTWQSILIDEEKALHDKILKLDEFLSGFDEMRRDGGYDLLMDQLAAMIEYHSILNERIGLL